MPIYSNRLLNTLCQQLATGLLDRVKCCICLGGIRALSEDVQLDLGLGAGRTNDTLIATLKIELNNISLRQAVHAGVVIDDGLNLGTGELRGRVLADRP